MHWGFWNSLDRKDAKGRTLREIRNAPRLDSLRSVRLGAKGNPEERIKAEWMAANLEIRADFR